MKVPLPLRKPDWTPDRQETPQPGTGHLGCL